MGGGGGMTLVVQVLSRGLLVCLVLGGVLADLSKFYGSGQVGKASKLVTYRCLAN